ncbi:MAG: (2Fe-2S)-binding protein [Chloroflexi bacterium]|nr:(2Fe-2S)-binding protein [Chloroflexota bacterium]
MSETFTLSINGIQVTARKGQTLLEVARKHGIDIPTICYHPATQSNGLCRMCVVEVEGMRLLQPACVVPAQAEMKVRTDSPRVHRARKTILEMLASTADLSEAPEIQRMMQAYQADPSRFPEAEPRHIPPIDDNPMYVREYSKCILCWRCVQICAEDAQYTYAINFSGRGYHTRIDTFYGLPMTATTCVFCGQCVGVCPTDALEPKSEYLLEQGKYPFPFR